MSQANSNMGMDDFGGAVEYDAGVYEPEEFSQPAPQARKKGVNIYTLFLILSLIFLIAGSIFLFNNVEQYQLR